MAHADASDKFDEAIAAVQKHMLTVIDLAPADFKGRCAAAEQPRTFEEIHRITAFFEIERGRKTGESRPDDRYTLRAHTPNHALTIAPIFSVLERPARSCSGSVGSRSIFSRIRS